MDGRRLKGILGLCVRAGKAAFGEEVCRKSLECGKCGILLLDEAASANTRDRYDSLCKRTGIEMALLPEGFLSEATGRSNIALAVMKGSFAEQVGRCLKTGTEHKQD